MSTKKEATAGTVAGRMANPRSLYGRSKATADSGERKGWRDNPKAPADWRERLPDPATYYAAKLAKLTRANPEGWAQARCLFHDDKAASLSVNLSNPRGGWKCFSGCGAGDLVAFHMRLKRLAFPEACADLLRGG